MARRLSNLQMNILAERVTDELQTDHEARTRAIKDSKEYKDFEHKYSSPNVDKARELVVEYREAKRKVESLELQARELKTQWDIQYDGWRGIGPESLLELVLQKEKDEKYPNINFDRDKILRKVQADILLSDLDVSPEQLVKELVEKLK